MAKCRDWNVDSTPIEVRNTPSDNDNDIEDCGSKLQCPNCSYNINDIAFDWSRIVSGLKFDPSDAELLDHLAAKCGVGNHDPLKLTGIDKFIRTLDKNGICNNHPKDLPGARDDGSSFHFFHKTANAYASGQRKRRKIQSDHPMGWTTRWHKTGKTKPVVDHTGAHKGCKKIMVLYKRGSGMGSNPVSTNWVMHQYHLGSIEDENEGEFVVSKIFYKRRKQNGKTKTAALVKEESLPSSSMVAGPETPNLSLDSALLGGDCCMSAVSQLKKELDSGAHLAGVSQAVNCNTNAVRVPDCEANDVDDNGTCADMFNLDDIIDVPFSEDNLFN